MPVVHELTDRLTKRTLRAWAQVISFLLLAVTVLITERYLETRYMDRYLTEQRDEVSERLSGIRYQLESTLANNLSLINGLAAFITAYPDFTQIQFEQYAATVIALEPALVNLAVAPDLIVRYVYPAEGNEAAIGLNYMTNPVQREAVQRAVETSTMVIAGPFELVQGGRAFVGRAPVYLQTESGDEALWGIVSSPMLVDSIYEKAGLNVIPAGMDVAIRSHDGVNPGAAFFGREAVFDTAGAVVMPVIAGGSTMEIAAVPTGSSAALQGNIRALRIASVTVFLLLALLLAVRYRQRASNQLLRSIIFKNERFLRAVESVSRVGGWHWAGDRFTEVSEQAREIMQLSADQPVSAMEEFCQSLDSASKRIVENCIRNAARQMHRIDQELELRRNTGEIVWLHLKSEVLNFGADQVELVGAIQDVSQQKKADQLIEYQANYDLMTALPNRALFNDRLVSALLSAGRRSTRLAVLFIDLDNFKSVNDNLGHDAGDELLVQSAQRIKSCMRAVDTVGRYSGDEFVALLVDVLSVSVIARITDDIVNAMRAPFDLSGRQIYSSVSIGVSFYPEDGNDPDTLLIKADQAMYEVKKSGRNAWQFYSAAMQRESEHKHTLYNDLVSAINNNQLTVYFQPVVDTFTGQIISCEALVRWLTPHGSWVPPDVFIPVAEERGLINRIDLLVLTQALEGIRRLNTHLYRPIGLSVNVSPKLLHLRDDDAQQWLQVLKCEHQLAITIEITERVLIDEVGNTSKVLEQIHAAGVRIAIDDFGTGYSGLSYFSRFPVSTVKIDRSFVRDIGIRPTQTTLVETILLLANKLGIQVVAEGVETEEQARFLRENKCDFLQGYYISAPLPELEFAQMVISQQKALGLE